MIIKKNIGRIISTGFGMVVLGCGLNKLMEQTIDITEKGQYVNTLPLLVGVVGSVIGIKFIDIGIKKIENFKISLFDILLKATLVGGAAEFIMNHSNAADLNATFVSRFTLLSASIVLVHYLSSHEIKLDESNIK